MEVLGIDIGSYGIKGCVVDTAGGTILSDRYSTDPLEDTSPHKILSRLHEVVKKHFDWHGPVGCAFPAPVRNGIVLSAKRIDAAWADADAEQLFTEITDNEITIINDTDATGIAEMHFGSGADHHRGLVMVLTVGTGIGSSLFMDGQLVPNTELGLMEVQGMSVEQRASNRTRKQQGFGKKEWAQRLQQMLETYEKIFHPDLFILGGQLSRKADKIFPYIKVQTTVKAAGFMNDASIVGAAMVAARRGREGKVFYR